MENIEKKNWGHIDIVLILPFLALIAAVFLWGGSFSAMRYVVGYLSPMSVMWIRMAVPLLILLPFYRKLKPVSFKKGDLKILIPMALLQPCFYFLLESYALTMTTSTQAGVISAAVPLFVAFGAFFFLKEKLSHKKIAGLIICIAGVVILTTVQKEEGVAQNPVLGNFFEVLAMVCAAANMVMVKKLSDRYSTWTLTAIQIIAGFIFFSPGLFYLLKTPEIMNIKLFIILLFLGCFVTLGAFGLYNWGMSRIEASKASTFINLVPVTAIFFGWLILGESLNSIQLLAAFIVLAGVLISQKS